MTETSTATANPSYAPSPRPSGFRAKHIVLLVLLAFVVGAIAFGWGARHFGLFEPAPAAPTAADAPAQAATPVPSTFDNNLGQIAADSVAATGGPSRGDALLAIFATQRALDSGASLGYLTEQLRVRFGGIQPKAVETVIAAAQTPVTLQGLQTELDSLGGTLVSGSRDTDLWSRIKREMSELFVLRRDNGPVDPAKQLVRVQALIESGNVAAAIKEVGVMPGAPMAKRWLARAQRYADARAALELLERTAIVTGGAQAMVPPETTPVPPVSGDAASASAAPTAAPVRTSTPEVAAPTP